MKAIERKMNSNNPDTDLLHAEQICRHRHTQTHTHIHADTCTVALVDTDSWRLALGTLHLAPDTWHLTLGTWHLSLTSALHLAEDRSTSAHLH